MASKILLQRLWLENCDWDDRVPDVILNEWNRFCSQLSALSSVSIPRWTDYREKNVQIELHGFADTSSKTYAAVVYIRVERITRLGVTTLLIAESKVAPINTISIPRLELCAAHLLTRLMKYTRDSLQIPNVKCYCWSDSIVTLEWIRQPPLRWETFVANRVSKIQELGKDFLWKYLYSNTGQSCRLRFLRRTSIRFTNTLLVVVRFVMASSTAILVATSTQGQLDHER